MARGVGAHGAIPEALVETGQPGHTPQPDSAKRPIILCANNGYAYVEAAYAFLKSGGDTLDAGAGNDVLHGDAGDDVLKGGPGNDAITGDPAFLISPEMQRAGHLFAERRGGHGASDGRR